ncbi:MAG: FtsX-like permease family protein, partial [Rhodothermales bacterium]
DPLGHSVKLFDQFDLIVTGVTSSQPAASHFHPDLLVSFRTTEAWTEESERSEWGQYNNYGTYVLLSKGADAAALQAKLPSFLRAHYEPDNHTVDGLVLQPLTSIHLDSHLDGEFEPNGNRTYVILFIAVAVLVLVIACFNFINLATARASYRGKEVGMRKVMGAERRQLVTQFLGESIVLTSLALVAAVFISWLVMPAFTQLSGQSLSWSQFGLLDALVAVVSVIVVVSLLAGLIPAVYLSRVQPKEVFRQTMGGSWRSKLRSTLVVTQFAVSIVLIVGVGVVLRQLSYLQQKDLGFDKEHLVVLPITAEMQADFEPFRNQLESSPLIEHVTASKLVPSKALVDHVGVSAQVDGEMRHASLALNPVDYDFLATYGMELTAGRSFSMDLASDSTEAFVINEAAVRLLGWSSAEDAIGRPFVLEASSFRRPGVVTGVVKNFNFESLRNEIAPLVLFIMPERWRRVTVRVAASRINEALAFLEQRWKSYRPEFPFTYSFVNEDFGALYQADRKVGTLFGYFSILAVVIASLGLLGLASFVMDRRRKEIGVRKVLGATVASVVRMLSMDFLRLIGLAFLVACPVAYLVARRWLEGFAYRSDIEVWLFAAAGFAVALIALATVSIQSIRSALVDPAVSLKHQ